MTECTKDVWLSDVIKRPAYKLNIESFSNTQDLHHIKKQLERESFVYFRSTVRSIQLNRFFQSQGFYLVETNIYLEKKNITSRIPIKCDVRFAQSGDQGEISEIAKNSFIFSRFHLDPHFDSRTANIIKSSWVNNYFAKQRGDAMIVAYDHNEITGFLLLLFCENKLIIDLI